MEHKYLFIVRNYSGEQLAATEILEPVSLMQIAHGLIDLYVPFNAERCEIWARTDHSKMILLGTAF